MSFVGVLAARQQKSIPCALKLSLIGVADYFSLTRANGEYETYADFDEFLLKFQEEDSSGFFCRNSDSNKCLQ